MKLLFFAERINIDFFKGDSLLLKRMMQGLAGKGSEIHAICHGHSGKVKVFPPADFWLYTKVFTFPLASFFAFKKFISLIEKNDFDAVVLKLPVCSGSGFWFELNPLIKGNFYSKIFNELKKRDIAFFVFVEGITEKDNFVSSLMGCSKETQINLLKKSDGVISLSELQNKILFSLGLNNPMAFFPAPVDTKKYFQEKISNKLNLSKEKINLLYLSSSCDLKDFLPFFNFIQVNNCVLYVISPFSSALDASIGLDKEIKKRNLETKIVFLTGFSNKTLFGLIPLFDAGVYLKKFNSDFADASYMMKISEYLSCGLPVLLPDIKGPIKQAGNAGINFEKTKTISKNELNNPSFEARNTAVKNLNLEKNICLIQDFIEKNIKDKKSFY